MLCQSFQHGEGLLKMSTQTIRYMSRIIVAFQLFGAGVMPGPEGQGYRMHLWRNAVHMILQCIVDAQLHAYIFPRPKLNPCFGHVCPCCPFYTFSRAIGRRPAQA